MDAHTRVRRNPCLLTCVFCITACGTQDSTSSSALTLVVEPPTGSVVYGTFEGRTPCDHCERTKIALSLFQQVDAAPTTYLLYWLHVGGSDVRYETRGSWSRSQGIPIDADADVILLDSAAPEDMRQYAAFGENLLLLLDANREPRVGNASHAFTLSRTQ